MQLLTSYVKNEVPILLVYTEQFLSIKFVLRTKFQRRAHKLITRQCDPQ